MSGRSYSIASSPKDYTIHIPSPPVLSTKVGMKNYCSAKSLSLAPPAQAHCSLPPPVNHGFDVPCTSCPSLPFDTRRALSPKRAANSGQHLPNAVRASPHISTVALRSYVTNTSGRDKTSQGFGSSKRQHRRTGPRFSPLPFEEYTYESHLIRLASGDLQDKDRIEMKKHSNNSLLHDHVSLIKNLHHLG